MPAAESRVLTFIKKYPPAGKTLLLCTRDGDNTTIVEQWEKATVQGNEVGVAQSVVDECEQLDQAVEVVLCWLDSTKRAIASKVLSRRKGRSVATAATTLVQAGDDDAPLMPTGTPEQHAEMSGAYAQRMANMALTNNAAIINQLNQLVARLTEELGRYRDRERDLLEREVAHAKASADTRSEADDIFTLVKAEVVGQIGERVVKEFNVGDAMSFVKKLLGDGSKS